MLLLVSLYMPLQEYNKCFLIRSVIYNSRIYLGVRNTCTKSLPFWSWRLNFKGLTCIVCVCVCVNERKMQVLGIGVDLNI